MWKIKLVNHSLLDLFGSFGFTNLCLWITADVHNVATDHATRVITRDSKNFLCLEKVVVEYMWQSRLTHRLDHDPNA